MIIAIIFILHIIFTIYIFVKKFTLESLTAALLNLILIIVIFAIGWSLIALVVNLIISPAGFGKIFDRNTISLTLLTISEFFIYRIYYKDMFVSGGDKEKQ